MRYVTLLVAAAWACLPGGDDVPGERPRDTGAVVQTRLDAPPVVDKPAVVVFWLDATDTLRPGEAAAAYDELTLATEAVVGALSAFEIELLSTRADTVYVVQPGAERRVITLAGREYPYGYVLVEPGGIERVLDGAYGSAELLDEIRVYFDLPDDAGVTATRIVTD